MDENELAKLKAEIEAMKQALATEKAAQTERERVAKEAAEKEAADKLKQQEQKALFDKPKRLSLRTMCAKIMNDKAYKEVTQ